MNEINKLRTRLSHVQTNVTEYRMTVSEAKDLLKEIEELQKVKLSTEVLLNTTHEIITNRILDGGSFNIV